MIGLSILVATALTACGPAGEAGVSFIAEAPPERPVTFRLLRGAGWEEMVAHRGAVDSRGYDYPLVPGERVTVQAETAGADGAAVRVTHRLTVADDTAYAMIVAVASEDPTRACMGCGVPVSAPIAPDDPDGLRLWLYETFNGISAPILF